MRRTIFLILFCLVFSAFSQETPSEGLFRPNPVKADVRWNRFTLKHHHKLFGYKYPFATRMDFFVESMALYEGLRVPLVKNISLTSSVGLEYTYLGEKVYPQWRESIDMENRWLFCLIRYNYAPDRHHTMTRTQYKFRNVRCGIETANHHFGPRVDWNLEVGQHCKRISIYGAYLDDQWLYGVSWSFGEWFPKIDEKRKNFENNLFRRKKF